MPQPRIRTTPITGCFPAPEPRPPTRGERNIEVARRQTLALYHHPYLSTWRLQELENWYLNTVVDPSIAPHVADIHLDGEITNRQQALFLELKWKESEPMLQPHYDDNDVWIDYHRPTDKECVYGRILELYSARQNYIQEESVRRLSVWLDWYAERMKPKPLRDESVVAACQSTISFLEDDYLKRKVDFATEVYAVLDKAGDTKRAKKVVDDLVELFPWLKKDFCGRLMNSVVAYDGLKNKLPQV